MLCRIPIVVSVEVHGFCRVTGVTITSNRAPLRGVRRMVDGAEPCVAFCSSCHRAGMGNSRLDLSGSVNDFFSPSAALTLAAVKKERTSHPRYRMMYLSW